MPSRHRRLGEEKALALSRMLCASIRTSSSTKTNNRSHRFKHLQRQHRLLLRTLRPFHRLHSPTAYANTHQPIPPALSISTETNHDLTHP